MAIGKVASHNDLGGYISHWLENTAGILLTFGEVSQRLTTKPLLFKRRGLGRIVNITGYSRLFKP